MITSDPAFVEAAGYAGYDFVLLDMEHGPGTFENLQNLIRAANVAGVCPMVRVPRGTDIWIDQALDVGAGAVMIPQIDTAEQARIAVSAAKFSPAAPVGPAALSVPPPMVRSPVRITLPRHRTPW
ncbi:MAG: aldolase/citrate lyase family protein [Oscillospiraceae bacterium]